MDLRVEPDASFECPITSDEANGADRVGINAAGDRCTVDLQFDDETVVTSVGNVRESCLCSRLQEFDCVPHISDVEGGAMLVQTYIEDRETIRPLVAELREAVGDVSLERLAVVEGAERSEETTVDLSALTPKQREALEIAVFRGYFDGDAVLAEVAADLGVSKSAVSQRLRAAEAKLVRMALDSA